VKYFTREWWSSGCADRAPVHAYLAHFKRISADLPPSVLEFEAHHTLHDARLETVSATYGERALAFSLSGWNQPLSQPVRYSVLFLGVASFEQHLPTGRDAGSELGDIGYWEYQIEPPHIELRILFAGGAEFRVLFGDVRFTHLPVA
jgi:hypothetical protein